MIISAILGAFIQVLVALIIAFIVFWFLGRGKVRFAHFLGIKTCPPGPVVAGLLIGAVATVTLLAIPGFAAMARGPGTVPGEALKSGLTDAAILALIVTAIFKTALAEELLFRGILGKQLIRWLGFNWGNSIQAALFGALHLLLARTPEATTGMVAAIVVFSAVLGWINGWLNEKWGTGSIVPGWACHAAANLCSYLSLAYGLF